MLLIKLKSFSSSAQDIGKIIHMKKFPASLIVKYGPSLKRRWELEAMMKNIWGECFWKDMTYKRYYHYYKLRNQVMKEKSAA